MVSFFCIGFQMNGKKLIVWNEEEENSVLIIFRGQHKGKKPAEIMELFVPLQLPAFAPNNKQRKQSDI
jgi:hypothetical protein